MDPYPFSHRPHSQVHNLYNNSPQDYQLHLLEGLPPLPRSLSAFHDHHRHSSSSPLPKVPSYFYPQAISRPIAVVPDPVPPPAPAPAPPPRPGGGGGAGSRRSSSSGSSSFRASPEQRTTTPTQQLQQQPLILPHQYHRGSSSSPIRSTSSISYSPNPYQQDSGLGRSSADSFSGGAFVRVIKSPIPGVMDHHTNVIIGQLKKDMQQLRQQDMALLGELLVINQGIQDLKNILLPAARPPLADSNPFRLKKKMKRRPLFSPPHHDEDDESSDSERI